MFKILLILQFCFLQVFALEWLEFDEAIKIQEKNSKVIMIDVIRSHCQYCKQMNKNVFDDKEMSKWIEKRFIPVKVNLDDDILPIDVDVRMTPTFYFVDKNQKIIKRIPGSWNIQDFKDLTKKIKGNKK